MQHRDGIISDEIWEKWELTIVIAIAIQSERNIATDSNSRLINFKSLPIL